MLTAEELDALRSAVATDPDRGGLLATLQQRGAPLLAALPHIPRAKALLSKDGGFCPDDGATLRFDPWSPERHECPRCGKAFSGDRHYRNWARAQHLWLAERTAELALVAALTGDERSGGRAVELLASYEELYFELPNRDNVLGPSHLFFSTYLESIWVTSYLAGAFLLREAGLLPDERIEGINRVAEAAANLIGEFNEGLSNRQSWHAAALTAVAVWFDDLELARTAVESRTGLLGHLADGFGEDGMWWEGENYHLFALRGLLLGLHWARAMGFDLLDDPELRLHLRCALLGPTKSALPDFTYPARRDSRYGVSLAQPASLELWETGRAWLGGDAELESWLAALYAVPLPLPRAEQYDAWLHDAGRPNPARPTRGDLSWWALTTMGPAPPSVEEWRPAGVLLERQGLAVLRHGASYASLECGPDLGGHGHPDRLHLTLHARGVHWLPDPGTGSYVHASLAWYRSALAHNAPQVDGNNAGGWDAWCAAFEAGEEWSWCRGRAGEATRTLILAPTHLVDVLEFEAPEPHHLELPWHFQGAMQVESAGTWAAAQLEHSFVGEVERFVPQADASDGVRLAVAASDTETAPRLRAFLSAPGAELVRAVGPGVPTHPELRPFLLLRADAARARWISVLDLAPADPEKQITQVSLDSDVIELSMPGGSFRYRFTAAGLEVWDGKRTLTLAGLRRAPVVHRPIFEQPKVPASEASAPRIVAPPRLDGTLEGFDLQAPLLLDSEHQYRRSEEPYDPERIAARAWLNWDGEALYLAAAVSKPELIFRAPDAPPLLLDNEPEDTHSDGLQLYWRVDDTVRGFLVIPGAGGAIRARPLGTVGRDSAAVSGCWKKTAEGYLVTLRLDDPAIRFLGPGARLGFDLLVNEMQPGRLRRSGQLVWSGAGGWIYLRGDRHELSQAGSLELG